MFKNLRLRITLWFLALSAVISASMGIVSLGLFKRGLTEALDDELAEVIAEHVELVDYCQNKPTLKTLHGSVNTEPTKMLASIEIFDNAGNLLQTEGKVGGKKLLAGTTDSTAGNIAVRSISQPLLHDNKIVGHIQVQIPTTHRDQAIEQFAIILAMTAPLLILLLTFAGYIFSAIAIQPVERSFTTLKNFMIDIGHEINTPIAIIRTVVENLERRLGSTSPIKEKIDSIEHCLGRIQNLVKDLRLLSTLESLPPKNMEEPVDLSILLKELTLDMSNIYQEKDVELMFQCDPDLIVKGRPEELERLFTNLLDNALRYTPEGGHVRITGNQSGTVVRITVSDTGIGIPGESLPFIFDRFFRVDPSRSRESGGAGLGLSIVKAITESHRARIEASSIEGKGATFSLYFPTTS